VKEYYYYKVLRKTIVQFLDTFNDIQVARYDEANNFQKYVEVPLKFSPKEKIWYWLAERKDYETLPIMSAAMTGVEFAADRATNRTQSISTVNGQSCTGNASVGVSAGTISSFLNPAPYDLTFQINIWTLYMADIPEIKGSFDVKVIFEGASPDIEMEYTDDTFRVLKYTLDFRVQTMLFKPVEPVGYVGKVIINYFTDEGAFGTAVYENTSSTFTSAASGESQVFTGVDPYFDSNDKRIYDYEVFQFGERVGDSISEVRQADYLRYDTAGTRTPAGSAIPVRPPLPYVRGVQHVNHAVTSAGEHI
jgi:hypothetical protein